VGNVRYVVCKDEVGKIRAFHNVCRHHAAAVASGSGCTHTFVCPYHVSKSLTRFSVRLDCFSYF